MPEKTLKIDLAQALGDVNIDKRIEILRQVGLVGSISEAARVTGVSYKAAWQAIETLGNLAGKPMVEKAVGGSGGGGAQLTQEGQKVLEGAELLSRAKTAVFAELEKGFSNFSALGFSSLNLRTSMRNHLPCQIQQMKKNGAFTRVVMELGEGQLLASKITEESAQLLGLVVNMDVLALCKATGVSITSTKSKKQGVNVLKGKVTRISNGKQSGEVSIRLNSGFQLVGFSTQLSSHKVGDEAYALVDETSVVIALT